MKFNHFTFTVGGPACNANCPFCVSRMTGKCDQKGGWEDFEPNWNRFRTACHIARKSPELTTALLTGKGEPTLYPRLITSYLEHLKRDGDFPIIELQTNGINLAKPSFDKHLEDWKNKGLEVIALSVVHYKEQKNQEIYCNGTSKGHYDLKKLIKKLHDMGYSVRLCVMMLKGYVDSTEEIDNVLEFCSENEVEQLTMRSIMVPEENGCKDREVFDWTEEHMLSQDHFELLFNHVKKIGTKLLSLSFGATVYGVRMSNGRQQGICFSNCLTETDDENSIRQLIFFPEKRGSIRYSWQNEAAIII